MKDFFLQSLKDSDKDIYNLIYKELNRQQNNIELIASENIVSKAVLESQGSILTNKYAEGYPSNRYYGGCEYVDEIENIAIQRACKLFNCNFANVQPHSGSQANMGVYIALLNPYDCIMGMDLSCGGHLTHGSSVSFSGKIFKSCSYVVNEKTHLIDYDHVEQIAKTYSPKLIIAGGSSYSRFIDFKKFREIADKVGAYLMVDMAHFAGLVATGLYNNNPLDYAHVCTSTTHKTLRGARGGLILTNDEKIIKKINSSIFPGIQGGPLLHIIAGKAVAFGEALKPEYKNYMQQVVINTKLFSEYFIQSGLNVVSNGTDTHLLLLDLSSLNLSGKLVEKILDTINITVNKNSLPFDKSPPKLTSGIRLGAAAITTRGFKNNEIKETSDIIVNILKNIDNINNSLQEKQLFEYKNRVLSLLKQFPIYSEIS